MAIRHPGPDFAPTVDIHRKPGYDPAELFVDPRLRFPKLRVAKTLAKKMLGFRYLMDVIGTDSSIVKGTHGRVYGDDDAGPVFLCSDRLLARDRVKATGREGDVPSVAGAVGRPAYGSGVDRVGAREDSPWTA